ISTRLSTCGSSCATTGFRTGSSNHTTISSTIVARPGTSSSISRGASCLSDCVNGRTSSDQWDSVLPSGAHSCCIDPRTEVLSALVHDEVVLAGCCRPKPDILAGKIGSVKRQGGRGGISFVCRPRPPKPTPLRLLFHWSLRPA